MWHLRKPYSHLFVVLQKPLRVDYVQPWWRFRLICCTPRFIEPHLESIKAEECSWLSQTNKFNCFPVMLSITWGRWVAEDQSILMQNVEYGCSHSFPLRILFNKEHNSLRSLEAQKLKLLFLKHFSFETKVLQIDNKLNQPTINTTQSIADKPVWIHLTNINPSVRKVEQ